MPEIGEVRDFATGVVGSVPDPLYPGNISKAVMLVEQRIWTGEAWAKLGTEACARILSELCDVRGRAEGKQP